jgi:hypothetical protein
LTGKIKGDSQTYEPRRIWVKVKSRNVTDVVCAAVIGPIVQPRELGNFERLTVHVQESFERFGFGCHCEALVCVALRVAPADHVGLASFLMRVLMLAT